MKYSYIILLSALVLAGQSCKSKAAKKDTATEEKSHQVYRASVTMVNDLIHTKLQVKPDFEKKEMSGVATLTLKPHFYPVDSLILDARYMRIESIDLITTSRQSGYVTAMPLSYTYDSSKLRIRLNIKFEPNFYGKLTSKFANFCGNLAKISLKN